MKRAFTLVELLVVIAMIGILMASIGSGISQARRRAQIAKATQDVKEMTNAILAFRNYAPNRSLDNYRQDTWKPAQEGNLGMILGKEKSAGGVNVPVLYNAHLNANGSIVDPWGKEYEFIIRKVDGDTSASGNRSFVTAVSLPNKYRLTDAERSVSRDD